MALDFTVQEQEGIESVMKPSKGTLPPAFTGNGNKKPLLPSLRSGGLLRAPAALHYSPWFRLRAGTELPSAASRDGACPVICSSSFEQRLLLFENAKMECPAYAG